MLVTGPGSECTTHSARQHPRLRACFLGGGIITNFSIIDFIVLVSQLFSPVFFCVCYNWQNWKILKVCTRDDCEQIPTIELINTSTGRSPTSSFKYFPTFLLLHIMLEEYQVLFTFWIVFLDIVLKWDLLGWCVFFLNWYKWHITSFWFQVTA